MIVVEGPDGAGKTTLIEELAAKFDLPIAPRVVSKDTESMVASLKGWVEENVSGGFQATLFDRHRLISEPIYGSILRSHFEPGFNDLNWLYLAMYRFYNHCKPLIIYCVPPYEVVRANVQADFENQPKDVREQVRKIYSLYVAKAAADSAIYNALLYDYTNPHYKDAIFRAVGNALKNGAARV